MATLLILVGICRKDLLPHVQASRGASAVSGTYKVFLLSLQELRKKTVFFVVEKLQGVESRQKSEFRENIYCSRVYDKLARCSPPKESID